MNQIMRLEPVRVFAITSALLALVGHYVPDLPSPLFLGLAAAVLGVGSQVTRSQVTPTLRKEA